MSRKTYYHYTDRRGLKGILKSGAIKKSPKGRYGKGVYLTRLHPSHGREHIAQKNWDGHWLRTEMSGKVDYAIAVRLPRRKVKEYKRDICLIKEDVDLDCTTFKLYSKRGDHETLEQKYYDYPSSSESDSDYY